MKNFSIARVYSLFVIDLDICLNTEGGWFEAVFICHGVFLFFPYGHAVPFRLNMTSNKSTP